MTLFVLTLWIVITLIFVKLAYKEGRKRGAKNELSLEEKRFLEKERRELENFWTYNGDSQCK